MLSVCCFGLDSANAVSRGQAVASEKKRNTIATGVGQAESYSDGVVTDWKLETNLLPVAALPKQIERNAD